MVPKIAKAMNTMAVITGRLIANRVNHTVGVPLSPRFTLGGRPLFQGPPQKFLSRGAEGARPWPCRRGWYPPWSHGKQPHRSEMSKIDDGQDREERRAL